MPLRSLLAKNFHPGIGCLGGGKEGGGMIDFAIIDSNLVRKLTYFFLSKNRPIVLNGLRLFN